VTSLQKLSFSETRNHQNSIPRNCPKSCQSINLFPEIYSSFNELTHHPEEQTHLSVEKKKMNYEKKVFRKTTKDKMCVEGFFQRLNANKNPAIFTTGLEFLVYTLS